ncbi:hypothetical protein AAFF_G00417880, partial [Aldrovandia affinis]
SPSYTVLHSECSLSFIGAPPFPRFSLCWAPWGPAGGAPSPSLSLPSQVSVGAKTPRPSAAPGLRQHVTGRLKVLVLLSLLIPAGSYPLFQPLDCADIYNHGSQASGVYPVYPGGATLPFYVYCDMETEGGKWTVLQRRMDGTVNFFRGWDQYKRGFGSAAGEYWLGLETIHLMMLKKNYELRVDVEDFEGASAYAKYASFSISPMVINAELDGYTLHISGFTDGGAGDSLSYNNGAKFTTFDRDHDNYSGNCAVLQGGGFWHDACTNANPNGVYAWGTSVGIGVFWWHWKSHIYSLKAISMKMRPVSLRDSWMPEPLPM